MDVPARFTQFTEERKLLKNVTPKTLIWYKYSWRAFEPFIADCTDEKQLRTRMKDAVMSMMKQRKLVPQSINNYIRCMNAFMKWMHEEDGIARIKLDKLRAVKKVIEILPDEQVARLLSYRPTKVNDKRVWTMAMIILDCGLRLDEVRKLKRIDLDFENFLLKVFMGKGRKQRLVPFTVELRKILYKWCAQVKDNAFLFTTRSGRLVSARNITRDLQLMGEAVGVSKIGFHLLRHTMATSFLKRGGNVVNLQKILGHSSLNTTMVYVHLQTEDMVADHQHLSILSARIA